MGRFRNGLTELLTAAGLLGCGLALVCHPREISEAVTQGMALCGKILLPALFPYFVLTSLVISLGLARRLGRLLEPVMGPLFRLGGACAIPLALGFLGGYPVGARAALCLYRDGQCSRSEAERLLAFCNNAGPSFILGVVGVQLFGGPGPGLLLWLTHMAAALCVGLLLRFAGSEGKPGSGNAAPVPPVSFPTAFTRAVTDGLSAALNLCAFVVCFTVILRLCGLMGLLPALSRLLGRLGLPLPWSEALLTGLLELSSGVNALRWEEETEGRLLLAAFLLGWGGLSVHGQTLSLLSGSGLRCRFYWLGKLLQGGIAACLTGLVLRLWPAGIPVGSLPGQGLPCGLFPVTPAPGWVLLLLCLLWAGKKAGNCCRGVV